MYHPAKGVNTDNSKSKNILGWKPTSLEEAMKVTTEFFNGAHFFREENSMMGTQFSLVYDYYFSLK